MYKHITIILIAILLAGCGITKEATFIHLRCDKTLEEIEPQMDTLYNIHHIIASNVLQVPDKSDGSEEYKSPLQTWNDKGGDCEDFAILCAYFIEKLGYEYTILSIYYDGGAHAIVVWTNPDGKYQYSTNGRMQLTNFDSYQDIAMYYNKTTRCVIKYKLEDINYIEHKLIRYTKIL